MLKKTISLMLAAVMVLSLSVTAYATETEPTEASSTSSTEPTKQSDVSEPSVPATTAATQPTVTSDPPIETTTPTQPTQPTTPSEPITEPTTPTQPTQPTTPSEPPTEPTIPSEPTKPQIPTALEIDTEYIYSGMDMAYEDGYRPRISDGYVRLVLPLKTNGDIYAEKIEVSLSMDASSASPFIVENFRKTFYLDYVTPENSNEEQELFLVDFYIGLSDNRINGTYPITVNVSGFDSTGTSINCIFNSKIYISDVFYYRFPVMIFCYVSSKPHPMATR